MNNMVYVSTKDGLSITFPGKKSFMVAKDHPHFKEVVESIKSGKATLESIEKLVDLKKEMAKLDFEGVAVTLTEAETLVVTIDGKPVNNLAPALQRRLLAMFDEGDDLRELSYMSFARFLKNLFRNPSYRSVQQLYGFLEANDLPITPNGKFFAYKKVAHDYLDIHSHTFDNSIGKTVEMNRNEVDDNPDRTCSAGLHVCSESYLPHYGSSDLDHVMVCEVDPADVVSIPTDYNNAKMRTCKYVVVDEMPNYFDATLGSYVYGNHKQGWIRETFDKLVNFYKKFFEVDRVEFDSLPDTIVVTPPVIDSFYKEAEDALGAIPQKVKDISYQKESIPTIKALFQWLSKYDTDWVRKTQD